MKKDKHPKYQKVLFIDSSTGYKFVCGTTLQPQERETFEGQEYPVCRVAISSSSHPAYTREQKFVDTGGRIKQFMDRYGDKTKSKATPPQEEAKEESSGRAAPAKKGQRKKKS